MSKQYEIFGVKPKSEKLREFRKAFVDSIDCPTLYKVISSNPKWFYYRHGIYNVSEQLGDMFFQFGLVPIKENFEAVNGVFQEFALKGPVSSEQIKGINYEGKYSFIFSSSILMEKRKRNYHLGPVIPVNQDVYNLCKIEKGDFLGIEDDDISRYAEFFDISDKPELVITDNRIMKNFKYGLITEAEYREKIASLQKQESLVLSLRQGKSTN